jgi:predicted deacylase
MGIKYWSHVGERDGPHLVITGGVHGDEFEPMMAVRQLNSEIQGSLKRGRVTLVPCVNEPAYRLARRTADDGLDLARTCPGRSDGTVITERIAYELSELIRTADCYVDLHTGGIALSVYPLAGYMLHSSPEVLQTQRRLAKVFGLPLIWGTDASLNGRSLSIARDNHVPAIYAEYLGGGGCNADAVSAYVRGCRNILADLEMTDDQVVIANPNPLTVEDPRPNSGFMQINHPAPCEGLFQPAVVLGKRVNRGDLLGTITDLSSSRQELVQAAHTGCIIVLRTLARVTTNESLGVVLETDGTLAETV